MASNGPIGGVSQITVASRFNGRKAVPANWKYFARCLVVTTVITGHNVDHEPIITVKRPVWLRVHKAELSHEVQVF